MIMRTHYIYGVISTSIHLGDNIIIMKRACNTRCIHDDYYRCEVLRLIDGPLCGGGRVF